VLENMLKAEEARTGKRNFTALLNHEIFHKCVLACSFEMVVASYRMVRPTPSLDFSSSTSRSASSGEFQRQSLLSCLIEIPFSP
jgi:hypothetical protein